jgi:histidinol-phosphate/aromatic aminotransferase/cobyric acid decarboxylase-like protein
MQLELPCYGGYAEAARIAGVEYGYTGGDCIVVGRPNNPDGRLPSVVEVAALARSWRRVVVDESFLGFTGEPSCVGLAENVIVITSMTKTYGIPGLRLGWAWNLPEDAVAPWSVNTVALAAGLACVEAWDWPRQPPLDRWRAELAKGLSRWGKVCGAANFLLLRLAELSAATVRERAFERGVLVRDASTIPGCDGHFVRVAVRSPEENARTLDALAYALG